MPENDNQNTGTLPHIGAIVEKLVTEQGLTPTQFGRKMGVTSGTAKTYFSRPTLQTEIIWKLCFALKYDFFSDIVAAYPVDFPKKKDEATLEKMEQMKREMQDLKKENALLKELIKGKI